MSALIDTQTRKLHFAETCHALRDDGNFAGRFLIWLPYDEYGGGRMMKAAAAMPVGKGDSIIRRPVIIRITGTLTASNIAAIVSHHCDKVRKLALAVQRPVFAPVKRRRAHQQWEQGAA
jgi:hypothetical protein